MIINEKILRLSNAVEEECYPVFRNIDSTAFQNTGKVIDAFQKEKVSDSYFAGTSGYGYDDIGREAIDKIYARIFKSDAALVRIHFVNGTHAISTALYAMLRPGDTLVSVTGLPYDTLQSTIGISGNKHGSLMFYGIDYKQVDLLENGEPDYDTISSAVAFSSVKAVLIQRSIGYSTRHALSIDNIERICTCVKKKNPNVCILVDNCYGEFTDIREPIEVGADLVAGSLIKNPGGGLAPTGGYIAGNRDLVEKSSMILTTPGIAGECGPSLGFNKSILQGIFVSPHVVAQALKTAVFCAGMLKKLGIPTYPEWNEKRNDIIQVVQLGSEEKMKAFCLGIQSNSAVDSFLTPEPWPMPGYDCNVIMAAGTFVQGSSIEISADGPIREPYCVYLQGGITYESGKLAILNALSNITDTF